MWFLKPLGVFLLIFLAGCSLNANIRMQCDGKCEVDVNRELTVERQSAK